MEKSSANDKSKAPKGQPMDENHVGYFSVYLKDLREKSGYSQSRAAHATRISLPFIEALEDGDFASLPGTIFGRGFLKSLSKIYIGSVDQELIRRYDRACDHLGINCTNRPYIEEPAAVLQVPDSARFLSRRSWRQLNPSFYLRGAPLYAFYGLLISGILLLFWQLQEHLSVSNPSDLVSVSPPPTLIQPIPSETPKDLKADKGDDLAQVNLPAQTHSDEELVAPLAEVKNLPKTIDKVSNFTESGQQAIQSLAFSFPEKATLRYKIDDKSWQTEEFPASVHTWKFRDQADFIIQEPGGILVEYNSQKIGPLKSGLGYRVLTFKREMPPNVEAT